MNFTQMLERLQEVSCNGPAPSCRSARDRTGPGRSHPRFTREQWCDECKAVDLAHNHLVMLKMIVDMDL